MLAPSRSTTGSEPRARAPVRQEQARTIPCTRSDEAAHRRRHVDPRELAAGECVGERGALVDRGGPGIQNHDLLTMDRAKASGARLLAPDRSDPDLESEPLGNSRQFREQAFWRHAESVTKRRQGTSRSLPAPGQGQNPCRRVSETGATSPSDRVVPRDRRGWGDFRLASDRAMGGPSERRVAGGGSDARFPGARLRP